MIGHQMSHSAPQRVSTVEFLALGACFANHIVKTQVKNSAKAFASKIKK